jgi:3-deoxy-7-phosphoheptulonate synthase
MNLEIKKELPSAEEIKRQYPLTEGLDAVKAENDRRIEDIICGRSGKLLLIIGPCSADREDAVLEYVCRLRKLQEKVADVITIVPRIYTNKPRTTGEGYKGMLHQPDPHRSADMLGGLVAIRHLHMRVLAESGFSGADEMLYPENHTYLSDMLSYVAVGARSVESQIHRLTASGLTIPVGMKNPTSGDMNVMLNSIHAAMLSHTFIYRGWEVTSKGNPLTHAILRGSVSKNGRHIPNYHYEDLMLLCEKYAQSQLPNRALIVDTNHSNSGKQSDQQIRIAKEVLHSARHSADINALLKGLMIESYLEDGCQSGDGGVYGKSITDPCLGWEKTERLVMELADLRS